MADFIAVCYNYYVGRKICPKSLSLNLKLKLKLYILRKDFSASSVKAVTPAGFLFLSA